MLEMTRPTLAVAIAAAAIALIFPAQAPPDAQPSAARGKSKPNPGPTWRADEELRRDMARIRAIMDARLGAAHAGKLTAAQYRGLANEIHAEVLRIAAARKPTPEAEAKLHVVVDRLNEGTDAMAGNNPRLRPAQGLGKVMTTLNEYGRAVDPAGLETSAAVR